MQRTISSAQTPIIKFITPIWIIFFVAMFGWNFFRSEVVFDPPTIVFLLLFLGILIFSLWYNLRFKKVAILSSSLLVSNYLKEIKIPFSEISHITENVWNNIHPVTIHLKKTTEFGSKIVFMPTFRFFAFWSSHPIVKELNTLIVKNKNNSILNI